MSGKMVGCGVEQLPGGLCVCHHVKVPESQHRFMQSSKVVIIENLFQYTVVCRIED